MESVDVVASLRTERCSRCKQTFEFTVKRGRRRKYCSKQCRERASKGVSFEINRDITCIVCSAVFERNRPSRRFCSADCRYSWYSGRLGMLSIRPCLQCGLEFKPSKEVRRTIFCSDKCQRQYHGRHRRLALRAGGESQAVDRLKVFERDGWRCYLCRQPTPRHLRGTYDARAPELEHVVPLSRGGAHAVSNVACACRECNSRKRNRLVSEVRASLGLA
jgi:5-methylcytosine-specific restriction endonuclease McrA